MEVVRSMADSDKSWRCLCKAYMRRDFQAEKFFASGGDYSRPIHSDSLAISPTQVAEHKRLFPDIEIDSQCRPVFDKFKVHDDYLKQTGFIKHSGKKRKKGKRIA